MLLVLCLMILLLQSQTNSKTIKVMSSGKISLNLVYQQQRRNMIIKCCGNVRCLVNSTVLAKLKNTTNAEVLSNISSESSPSVAKKTTVGTEVTPDNAAESNLETTPSSFDPTDVGGNTISSAPSASSTNSLTGTAAGATTAAGPTTTTATQQVVVSSERTTTTGSTTTAIPTTTTTSCVRGFDRACRPEPTCSVDTMAVGSLQLTGRTLEGEMVSTANGKKYFMGSDNNGLTYDVAAAICCKLGMKLAEFPTIASWNNFLAYFKLQTFASWDYFGQTRDNGNNTDTWCASGTLVPDGIIPADMYNIPCGTKNLIVLTPGGNLTYINPANYIHRYFCE